MMRDKYTGAPIPITPEKVKELASQKKPPMPVIVAIPVAIGVCLGVLYLLVQIVTFAWTH